MGVGTLGILLLVACQPEIQTLGEVDRQLATTMRLGLPPPAPPGNRFADNPEAAELGRAFFSDPGFSATGTFSCASCHQPERRFTDGERVHTMLGVGKRNVPTIESTAWQTWFFWDGRADSAWSQAVGPILDPDEMGNTPAGVRRHVERNWREPFETTFGPMGTMDESDVLAAVGKAIEAHERTLAHRESAFDRFVDAGFSGDALSVAEQRGMALFFEKGCTNCHNGPMFTDHAFHNVGVPPVDATDLDVGRGDGAAKALADPFNCRSKFSDSDTCDELRFLDPTFEDAPGSFKTPSLRSVAFTAPYFHNGSVHTLEQVIEVYDRLPGTPLLGHRDLVLQPLALSTADRDALAAFLRVL